MIWTMLWLNYNKYWPPILCSMVIEQIDHRNKHTQLISPFVESLENIDNGQLKDAVSEVEGMLTSFIDTVESSRSSSAQLTFPVLKEANLSNNYKYV